MQSKISNQQICLTNSRLWFGKTWITFYLAALVSPLFVTYEDKKCHIAKNNYYTRHVERSTLVISMIMVKSGSQIKNYIVPWDLDKKILICYINIISIVLRFYWFSVSLVSYALYIGVLQKFIDKKALFSPELSSIILLNLTGMHCKNRYIFEIIWRLAIKNNFSAIKWKEKWYNL